MKCPNCGAMNSENQRYCGNCGKALPLTTSIGPRESGMSGVLQNRELEPGEKVLWQGKPVFGPFILSGFGGIIPGLMFFLFSLFWTTTAWGAGAPTEFLLIGSLFMLIGLFILLGGPIIQWLRFKNTEYIITDQRIITQTGAFGLDTRYIDIEWIREVYVVVSIIDRMFGTGSVMVSTSSGFIGGAPNTSSLRPSLASLRDPYTIQKVIRDASRKVKYSQQ